MKKTIKNTLALAAALTLLLTGCGSSASNTCTESTSSKNGNFGAVFSADSSAAYSEEAYAGYEEAEGIVMDDVDGSYESAASGSADPVSAPSDQKMIITWSLSMETENYTEIMEQLNTSIRSANGYIESENESTSYNNTHYCSLVIRIPASQIDSWINNVNDYGLITYRSQSQDNATLTYVDMESRISALRSEQEALLKLMDRADSMEDIITIQNQLTNVNYEIESYESQLRSLSNSVDYATVYLDICEVSKEVPSDQTMGEEILQRLERSIEGLGNFLRGLCVGILGNSVIIILAAAIIFAIVKLCKRCAAKSKQKRIAAAAAAANAMSKEIPHDSISQ